MASRHFGSTRKLASGRWQARYPAPDGQRYPAPHTFVSKKAAERWLSLKQAEIERGEWVNPTAGQITVQEWGKRWLESVTPSLKRKTRVSYDSLLRTLIFPSFGKRQIGKVRPIDVSEWVASMNKRKLSASRIRQAHVVLSQIMKAAVVNELIRTNPCQGVKLPRLPQTEPRILTDAEVQRLIAAADAPTDLIVQILAYGGLRIGEVFALRRGRVQLATGHLIIAESLEEIAGRHSFTSPKSHQNRVLRLPAFVVDALRAHLDAMTDADPSALLFTGRTGKPLHYNAWRTWRWNPAAMRAGLEGVTPHDLRATHASYVAQRHGVMAAARRLGHSNASVTTRHYARALDGADDDIAAGLADQDHGAGAHTGHGPEDDDPTDTPTPT